MPEDTYRKRVQALCDELGIQNPIQEEDLTVSGLAFWNMQGECTEVLASDMNRAGRLFFQLYVEQEDPYSTVVGMSVDTLKDLAQNHFKEMWNDAEEAGRSMLTAFKQAAAIEVHWKQSESPE